MKLSSGCYAAGRNTTMTEETDAPPRFPKVHSPFKREENNNGEYVVYDEIADGYEWVFDTDNTIAVEKLDGTNCCVRVENIEQGLSVEGFTRHGYEPMQRADPYGQTPHQYVVRGIQNSLQRGYLDGLSDGVHYGECVGPKFQGNPHELDENLFIPFEWLQDKCHYKSWGDYPTDFDTISGWFKEDLFSLFYSRMHGTGLQEASVSNGTYCEGIVFIEKGAQYTPEMDMTEEHMGGDTYRKYAPRMAKLRRDMFEWFEGERH